MHVITAHEHSLKTKLRERHPKSEMNGWSIDTSFRRHHAARTTMTIGGRGLRDSFRRHQGAPNDDDFTETAGEVSEIRNLRT
jgi:hypothetical protein